MTKGLHINAFSCMISRVEIPMKRGETVWVRAPPPAMNSQWIFDVGR